MWARSIAASGDGSGLSRRISAGAAEDARDRGVPRFPGEEPHARVGGLLDDVGIAEDRVVMGHRLGKIVEVSGNLADLLGGDFPGLPGDRLDERADAGHEFPGLFDPTEMAFLGVDALLLGIAGEALDGFPQRAVAVEDDAHAGGGVGDVDVALRPVLDQPLGNAGDPRVGVLLAVHLHLDAEPFAQEPGDLGAVDRAGGLLPAIERAAMDRAVAAVVMRPGDVQDHAMGVEVGIARAGRAMLEERRHEVGRDDPDVAVPVADPGVAAMLPDGVGERRAHRVVVRVLDL